MKLKQFIFALVAMLLSFSVTTSAQQLLVNCDYNSSTEGFGVSKFSNYAGAYAYATANANNATIVIEKTNTLSGNTFDNNHKNYTRLAVVIKDGATMGNAASKWDMTYPVTVEPGGTLTCARPKNSTVSNIHIKNKLIVGAKGATKKAYVNFLSDSYQDCDISIRYNGSIEVYNADFAVQDLDAQGKLTIEDSKVEVDGAFASATTFYATTLTNTEMVVNGNQISGGLSDFSGGTSNQLGNVKINNSTLTIKEGDTKVAANVTATNSTIAVNNLTVNSGKTLNLNEGSSLNAENITGTGSVKIDGVQAPIVDGAICVPVSDFAALKSAVEAGKNVQLTADITTTSAIKTSGVTSVIDLNSNKLTIGAGDNKFNDESNITIKNGTVSITGVTVGGNAIFCLDEYEKSLVTTVTLDNVNLVGEGYSSAYGIFYIGESSVLNVNGGEWNLKNDTHESGGVFKADGSGAKLNIDGLKLTAHNVRRVVTYAATTVENSTMAISGDADGVDAQMEHGFNRSPLAINNSTITMKDMVGRGITAQNGAVTISANSKVEMTNCQEATIDVRNNQTVTIDNTSTVSVDKKPTVASGSAINGTVKLPTVAKIGDVEYSDIQDALEATKTMTGDVTVEIYDKVTFNQPLIGNYTSIKFVGKDTDAEMYLDVQGYTTATGKKVSFTDLKLSKSEGGFIANAGFMNVAFGIYDVEEVTYNNCTFLNGACASSGKVTFNGCTFKKSWDKYGLWAYGNVDVTVQGSTFADYRGIKMYAENGADASVEKANLTVKNTNFSAVDNKPAIVLTYGESVVLEGNTYSSTGTFELDLDGKPNGVAVTSDVAPVCVNDNGACGVLVDGKIYTTVAQAAEVATSGSTVTLLHSSAETVALPMGVTLNKNNFEAAGVTVAGPVAKIGDVEYATLAAAINAAQNGETITLIDNVVLAERVTIPADKTLTIDLNGKSISMEESIIATAYAINNLGNLTITDGVGGGSINARGVYNGYGDGGANVATAKITVVNGTINAKGTNGGAAIFNYGIADIQGGNFTSIGGYSLNNQSGASMTIAAGVTANNGIYASGATLVVNGGEINGNRSGCHVLYAWNSNVTIAGGTFHNNNSGNSTTMAGGTTKLTIDGGTFSIANGKSTTGWTSCLIDATDGGKYEINGGEFKGHFRVQANCAMEINGGTFENTHGEAYVNGGTVAVKGGTFTDAAAQKFATDNLAAGYELNADGTVAAKPVAEVNDVKYASIGEAVAALKSNETLVITSDITPGANEFIELNGKTNVTLAAAEGVVIKGNIQVGYHPSHSHIDVDRSESTFTVDGLTVEGTLTVCSNDAALVVKNTKAAQITVKTYREGMDIDLNNNTADGSMGTATNSYGMYLVPNATGYNLKVDNNTFKNINSHAFVVQGSGDGSAVTAANSIVVTNNKFESWGTGGKDDRAAFKIWADTKYAPAESDLAGTTNAMRELVDAIAAGDNTYSSTADNTVQFDAYGAAGDAEEFPDPMYAVAMIGEQGYATIKDAVAAVKESETITILAGTHSEGTIKLPATLKNVTFKGAEGAELKDMTISAADGNAYSYEGLTFDGITFDNSRILLTGWRNGDETIENLVVTNCTFKNLNDDTNTAPIHINKEANEPVNGFTFTNNVIDGATGGSKSGIYAQVTGAVKVENNIINNVSFRPYVIQVTTDDGIADNFTVKGNTFSGSAVGRAQGLGNNAEGTDNVNLVVSNNIFKGITDAQQICYWNFNPETTTADLSKNYYDIDIVANPGKIYFNSAAADNYALRDMNVFPIYTALNEDGTINTEIAFTPKFYIAKVGENSYETLSEAFAAVTDDAQTVVVLRDVTENLTGAYLRGNITTENGAKVTITLTNSDWVYCPNTFVLGENITLNVPALFYYAGGSQINGTVVAGAYYQRYAGTKLTINEPGSMTVTSETCIIRYMDGDPNAGIYVVGDKNDETVGLKLSVAYFYQGMINAKDANIQAGTYWQTNETDGQGSANLVLDNSKLVVTVYDHPAKATGNSTVTLKNGSVLDAKNGGFTYGDNTTLSVDATSNIIGKNGALVEPPVAKIGTTKYTSLQAAFNAVKDSETITLIDNVTVSVATAAYNDGTYIDGVRYTGDKSFTVDFNGKTVTDDGCVNDYLIYINNKGEKASEITFTNGTIVSKNGCWSAVCVNSSAATQNVVLNLNGMNITNSNDAEYSGNPVVRVRNLATVNVNDKTVITSNGASYGVAANTDGSTLNIYEGATIVQQNSGTTGGNSVFAAVGGKGVINIKGGTITSDRYGVHTMTTGTPVINISGGTITAPVALKSSTNGGNGELATINVTGGTINGTLETYTDNGKIVVSGGTFSEAVAEEYCADGFVPVDNGDGTYGVVEVPKGNNFNGYTNTDGIWGETWGNAKESFVIKVLDANGNVMGTTSLNNVGGIIDGDVNVSWNLKFNAAANTDEYWTMAWTTAPTLNNMPAKVELWVDGTKVSGGSVVLNGPDDLNKINVIVTDAEGKVTSCQTTVANALAAAKDGETVNLLWKDGQAPLAMNGSVFGKNVTITGTATVDWSKGFLFVGRGGEGNATVTFDGANLTSASNSASFGIHVSGREKNTNNKYDGTLVIKNSTIELDYLINKGAMTLDNATLTVKNGTAIGGRPASETESGADATATISLANNSKLIVNNHNGMGLGYEAIGVMNIDATSTFETTQSFLVTAKGTMNIAGNATIAGTLTNDGAIVLTTAGAELTSTECGNVTTNVANTVVSYSDGKYTLGAAVAKIGDTYYATLEAALAAQGDEVELLSTYEVAAGETKTLDLKGKTINVAYAEGSTTNHIYAIDNKGTLNITGNGTINARGIFNYGAMTLENGTINAIDGNGGYGVRNYAGATFTMNGGTIATTLEDDHQVNNGGYDATTVRVDEGATFTMNVGELNNICDYTFAIDNYGKVTVNGGTVTSVHSTVSNYGTVTINGGSFTCNGLEGVTAHVIVAWDGSTTTINGGTFDGKDNYNGFNVDASKGANVVIKGGKFLSVHSGSLYGDGTITVSGGTFFDKISDQRCALGYQAEANAGLYTVKYTGEVAEFTIVDGDYDNFSIELAEPVTIKTLTYGRYFSAANRWNALYVPFEIPVELLTQAGYEVAYVNDVHSYDNLKADGTPGEDGVIDDMKMEVILIKNGKLNANYPYLIRANRAGLLNLEIENTKLYSTEEKSVSCSSVFMKFEVTGIYETKTAGELGDANSIYALGGGSWVLPESPNQQLKPFRLYLKATKIDGSPVVVDESTLANIRIRVAGEKDEVTGIITPIIEGDVHVNDGTVYDLMGRPVRTPEKGKIYIMNGKKVLF